MTLYTTAKLQLDMQPFRDAALAMADMELAHASKNVTSSELRTYVSAVDRALVTAQRSNPKLAEPFITQNASIQGDISQSDNIQQSFEKMYAGFIRDQNDESRKIMQEVAAGKISENEAKQKFVSSFIKKSDELTKKFNGFTIGERKVQENLEQLLKSLLNAFPSARSEDTTKLLINKKAEQETPRLG